MKNLKKIQGFSLPEMLVVVACLAVVIGLSYGDVTRMFDKQVVENEKLDLQEIRKAMELYAENEGKLPINTTVCSKQAGLPSNSTIWSIELAKYSNMSPDRICFDQMGNTRTYLSKKYAKTFLGGVYQYDVHYASVQTNGIDKSKDTVDWVNLSGSSGFTEYVASGDDILVKYTDSEIKLTKYKETLRRIETLEKYLERYARTKRSSAQSLDIDKFDNYIMFPKDGRSTDPGDYLDTSVAGIDSNSEVQILDDEIEAVSLTKVLGVPEYLGENAISGNTMWYISNPGADRTAPCDAAKSGPPYYPPAVIVTTGDARPTGC